MWDHKKRNQCRKVEVYVCGYSKYWHWSVKTVYGHRHKHHPCNIPEMTQSIWAFKHQNYKRIPLQMFQLQPILSRSVEITLRTHNTFNRSAQRGTVCPQFSHCSMPVLTARQPTRHGAACTGLITLSPWGLESLERIMWRIIMQITNKRKNLIWFNFSPVWDTYTSTIFCSRFKRSVTSQFQRLKATATSSLLSGSQWATARAWQAVEFSRQHTCECTMPYMSSTCFLSTFASGYFRGRKVLCPSLPCSESIQAPHAILKETRALARDGIDSFRLV